MFFIRKENISDFQDRCVIAVFLDCYPELHFMEYLGKKHFLGFTTNDKEHIYLFNAPEKKLAKGTIYCSRRNKSNDKYDYVVFKDGFIDEYRKFVDNPFKYIMDHFYENEWQEKYKGLFVSVPPNENDIGTLYKYKSNPDESDKLAVQRFLNFINGQLTFVNPSTCNDPFECECEIPMHDALPIIIFKATQKTKYSASAVKPISISKISEVVEDYYKKHDDKVVITRDFFKELVSLLYGNSIKTTKEETIIDNCVNMSMQICNLKKSFRILCLARKYDDILMWGYYGNSGKGVCCGHKLDEINKSVQKFDKKICVYGNISYPETNERPKFQAKTHDIEDDILNFIIKCTFTKYFNWHHENEYRYVLIGDDFDSDYVTIDSKSDCIYLGCKNSEVGIYKTIDMKPCPHKLVMDSQEYKLIQK